MDFQIPDPDVFFNKLKELQPSACALRAIYDCSSSFRPPPPLKCATPTEKAQQFVQNHECAHSSCNCSTIFVHYTLMYSSLECDDIEKSTRGQSKNDNLHKMGKGLLTASIFHKIIHSKDPEKTANSVLFGMKFDNTYVHDPISFGRRFEDKARDMFI
ncbi:hypothetical protein DPMN_084022 [Dreissena polymorpha]|uniref:Uncharacterized protein n=1 Tax=Dreissena polymorpha TaxID=45954 RepID=A0A9D3YD39_DREPO|nr:hypothetical protein DPMN_084022 [Dreissena polymorpha]